MTQNNLGTALVMLSERESGTVRLVEAVDAFRDALKEWTQEHSPYYRMIAHGNLENALEALREKQAGG